MDILGSSLFCESFCMTEGTFFLDSMYILTLILAVFLCVCYWCSTFGHLCALLATPVILLFQSMKKRNIHPLGNASGALYFKMILSKAVAMHLSALCLSLFCSCMSLGLLTSLLVVLKACCCCCTSDNAVVLQDACLWLWQLVCDILWYLSHHQPLHLHEHCAGLHLLQLQEKPQGTWCYDTGILWIVGVPSFLFFIWKQSQNKTKTRW